MIIRNLQEAQEALRPYIPNVKELTGKDTTLERIKPLMELLGNPQDKLRIVHVAGTSGKTSTAYYIAGLLGASGRKVGLTVSPHVDTITERVQIDGQPISDKDFCRELGEFLELVQKSGQPVSHFELLYAFAVWVFERRAVDYAVIETGLGGLYDATNVATRADKVCVLTDIGYDHQSILGDTLPEIAWQKAGIIHDGNAVIMYEQPAEVMQVVEAQVERTHGLLQMLAGGDVNDGGVDFGGVPAFQQRNWLLARAVYEYLHNRDKLPHLTSQALQKTLAIQVPGRMDVYQIGDKTLVMDGAHNAQKMTAFISSFQALYPDVKPALLLSLKSGKEYEELVPLLGAFASRIYVTTFDTTQDLPVQSMPTELLAAAFRGQTKVPIEIIQNHAQAFDKVLSSPEPVGVIAGSFYLLHQIRNNKHIHEQIDRSHRP